MGRTIFATATRPHLASWCRARWAPVGTVYIDPIWVNNSNPLPSELTDDNNSFLLGLGTRLRIRPSCLPSRRDHSAGGGLRSRASTRRASVSKKLIGGHVFQINFSNGFGTTTGQVARGGTGETDWHSASASRESSTSVSLGEEEADIMSRRASTGSRPRACVLAWATLVVSAQGDGNPAAAAVKNPVPSSAKSIADGQKLYQTNCRSLPRRKGVGRRSARADEPAVLPT